MFEVLPLEQGFSQIQIDLDKLFETTIEHNKFNKRFGPFMSSDPLSNGIIRLENNVLIYKTEHIIPSCNDGRKKVLFLLGNPATHSVHTGVPFSYEKKEMEEKGSTDSGKPFATQDI